METLNTLENLAQAKRLAWIDYRKAGTHGPGRRLVEPYSIESNGTDLMIRCWQREPAGAAVGWKVLRLDGIVRVSDGGATFEPRGPVTLGVPPENPFSDSRPINSDPLAKYRTYLQSCLLDGQFTQAELEGAVDVASGLLLGQMRAVHAQVLAAALQEAALDEDIDTHEADYIARLFAFLRMLGWAP